MSAGPLARMLLRRRVMDLAGPRFFDRGELYAQQRRVKRLNNNAYRAAVQRLDHIATLMTAAGQPEAFPTYVAEVRARHKPKRNLMKLLDQRGW